MSDDLNNETLASFSPLAVEINTDHNCANESSSESSSLCIANYYYKLDETRSLGFVIPFGFFVIFTLVANLLAMIAIWFAHKVPIITKILLSHLMCSCFVLGFLAMPLATSVEMFDGRWAFGAQLCRAYEMINVVLPAVILYGLAVIAIDQRLALNKLMTHGKAQNAWDAIKKCVAVWLVGAIAGVSAILGWRTFYPVETDDKCTYKDDYGFVIFRTVSTLIVPGAIMAAFIYSFNIKKAQEAREIRTKYHDAKLIDVEVCSGLHMKVHESSDTSSVANSEAKKKQQKSFKYLDDEFLGADDRVKKHKILWTKLKVECQITRALRMVSVISFTFFIPLFVCVVAGAFCSCVPNLVMRISLWLGYTTTIIIPSTCLIMVPKIRRALLRLCPCCRWCLVSISHNGDQPSAINRADDMRLSCRENRINSSSSAASKLMRLLRGQLSTSSRSDQDVETSPSLSGKTNNSGDNATSRPITSPQGVKNDRSLLQTNNYGNNTVISNVELTLDDLVGEKFNGKNKAKTNKMPTVKITPATNRQFNIEKSQSIDSIESSISTPSSTLTL